MAGIRVTIPDVMRLDALGSVSKLQQPTMQRHPLRQMAFHSFDTNSDGTLDRDLAELSEFA